MMSSGRDALLRGLAAVPDIISLSSAAVTPDFFALASNSLSCSRDGTVSGDPSIGGWAASRPVYAWPPSSSLSSSASMGRRARRSSIALPSSVLRNAGCCCCCVLLSSTSGLCVTALLPGSSSPLPSFSGPLAFSWSLAVASAMSSLAGSCVLVAAGLLTPSSPSSMASCCCLLLSRMASMTSPNLSSIVICGASLSRDFSATLRADLCSLTALTRSSPSKAVPFVYFSCATLTGGRPDCSTTSTSLA
mmetsp:Transcript_2625/g.7433  ORF Transcript_2625/g.7433 Transcript_2625/m.7433 type:complete len:248 (+) Transcript_2625:77-820(+)